MTDDILTKKEFDSVRYGLIQPNLLILELNYLTLILLMLSQKVLIANIDNAKQTFREILDIGNMIIYRCKNIDVSPSDLQHPIDMSGTIHEVVTSLNCDSTKSFAKKHCHDFNGYQRLENLISDFTSNDFKPHHNTSAIEPIDPILLGAQPIRPTKPH